MGWTPTGASRHEALEPVRQGVAERFDSVEKDAAVRLVIRHDHGSQYMSRDFQREIAWLGARSSPAVAVRGGEARAALHGFPNRRADAVGEPLDGRVLELVEAEGTAAGDAEDLSTNCRMVVPACDCRMNSPQCAD